METTVPSREEDRGYIEQSRWLHGYGPAEDQDDRFPVHLYQARHALAARLTTQGDNAYNRGATQATRDYVARLERGAAPSKRKAQYLPRRGLR